MTKKFMLIAAALALLSAWPVTAAPIPCPALGTYATLIGLSGAGNGCLINGLLFNNFTFAPSATGTGITPTATQVSYVLDDPALALNGDSVYGFDFNPN